MVTNPQLMQLVLMIPTSIVFLIGLSVLTYWGTTTGRTEDCGCYNGWLDITPTQSLILKYFISDRLEKSDRLFYLI